jgi:hypothetical protein
MSLLLAFVERAPVVQRRRQAMRRRQHVVLDSADGHALRAGCQRIERRRSLRHRRVPCFLAICIAATFTFWLGQWVLSAVLNGVERDVC